MTDVAGPVSGPAPDQVEQELIHGVGELSAELGLNRMVGQLYALLYLREEPLSLDQMAEVLRVSKPTVSVNIRELQRWGAVRKSWVEGDRKDYYLANRNTIEVAVRAVRDGLRRRVDKATGLLGEAEHRLTALAADEGRSETDRAAARRSLARLEEVKEMAELVRSLCTSSGLLGDARQLLKLASLARRPPSESSLERDHASADRA